MSSTRLRQKSIALSRIAYQIMNIICGIIVPRMLSPTAWNWGPKSGLFWGGVSLLTAIYLALRLPETKGRSYGELDLLFERKIPAWRFKSTKVDGEFGVGVRAEVQSSTSAVHTRRLPINRLSSTRRLGKAGCDGATSDSVRSCEGTAVFDLLRHILACVAVMVYHFYDPLCIVDPIVRLCPFQRHLAPWRNVYGRFNYSSRVPVAF